MGAVLSAVIATLTLAVVGALNVMSHWETPDSAATSKHLQLAAYAISFTVAILSLLIMIFLM